MYNFGAFTADDPSGPIDSSPQLVNPGDDLNPLSYDDYHQSEVGLRVVAKLAGAPTASVAAAGTTAMRVTWQDQTNTGGDCFDTSDTVTPYDVTGGLPGTPLAPFTGNDVESSPRTFTGLTPGHAYRVSVVGHCLMESGTGTATQRLGSEYDSDAGVSGTVTLPETSVKTTKAKAALAGTPVVGQTLTARPSGFVAGTSYRYTWQRNGAAIAGRSDTTSRTYRLSAADHRAEISVVVTGSRSGYTAGSVTSNRSSKILGHLLAAPKKITIKGALKVGKKLSVKVVKGAWTKGTTLAYAWTYSKSGNAHVWSHAAHPKIVRAAKGHRLGVTVTGRKSDYLGTSVHATSGHAVKP